MEDGQYVGGIKSSKNLYETLHNMWKQLYHEGRITKVTKMALTYNSNKCKLCHCVKSQYEIVSDHMWREIGNDWAK